ncbi:MAG: (2Fe-2S)-binding protein [Syntrophobacteraceae bacterium]|nr:(2Fe-2S)-binding protein [Syntrophobacteraceae bacterium]
MQIPGDRLVCHCFGHTREEIERDYLENGRSLILERVKMEKKAGGCQCATKSPSGK